MIFKCLYCQYPIKDGELVMVAICEHFIHEYCVELMKAQGEHKCKNCDQITIVNQVFKEFDKSKQCTIDGMSIIMNKLTELIEILKSRENTVDQLSKKHDEIADKLEGLLIEHHAVKYEKNEIDKRLKKVENDLCSEKKSP